MTAAPPFPPAEDTDGDDIRWALETARSMWSQGELAESLRWLKRAAESAAEAGNDMRSVYLAKAAADLRSFVEIETGAPLSVPSPSVAPLPPASASATPPSRPSTSATPPSRPPASLPAPPPSRPPASVPAPPPSRRLPPPARPVARPPSPDDSGPTDVHRAAVSEGGVPVDCRGAARVAVQKLDGSPGIDMMRLLKAGESVGATEREAFVVPVESGDMFV